MSFKWVNLLLCPFCGGEIAESKRLTDVDSGQEKILYSCFNKKCNWKGLEPGEIYGKVLE